MSNAFFFDKIMPMGGVETFLVYLARKYKDRDITVYYNQGDAEQLERLRRYVRIERITDKKIKCKKAFFNYSIANIDNVDADEYIFMVHADYKAQGRKPPTHPKINRYIAVSKVAARSFTDLTGKECEICYNPVLMEKDRPLILMSATRLSEEKGKDEMVKLATLLDRSGIKYIWFVFTNDTNEIKNKNIVYCKPRKDVTQLMNLADWFVQLSSAEAYCYSVVEANLNGVPCITTPLKVFDEIGIEGIKIDDPDLRDKIKKPYRVNYKAKADRWGEILTEDKSNYKPPRKQKMVTVKAKINYFDMLTGREERRGTELTVSEDRAKELAKVEVI